MEDDEYKDIQFITLYEERNADRYSLTIPTSLIHIESVESQTVLLKTDEEILQDGHLNYASLFTRYNEKLKLVETKLTSM